MKLSKMTYLSMVSAAALLIAAPASAAGDKNMRTGQSAEANEPIQSQDMDRGRTQGITQSRSQGLIEADTLLGKDIANSAGDEIGEIESVIIDDKGEVAAVVVGVGGFLGMGEHDVAIDWNDLQVQQGTTDAIRTNLSEAELRNMPEYNYVNREARGTAYVDRTYLDRRQDMLNQREQTMNRKAQSAAQDQQRTGGTLQDQQRTDRMAPDTDRESDRVGQTAAGASAQADWVAANKPQASNLIGAEVVNDQGKKIGEVEDVIVAQDGKTRLILSVGEFLGMGGDKVALDMDKAEIQSHRDNADEIRVSVSMTEQEIKALPKYEMKGQNRATDKRQ